MASSGQQRCTILPLFPRCCQRAALFTTHETIIYAAGIGGLLALCLRARGELLGVPIVMQAPVLWGLEHRLLPRLLRLAPTQPLLRWCFAWKPFQDHFVRRQFRSPLPHSVRDAFFAGYRDCPAAPDLFRWLTPAVLRRMELAFHENQMALRRVKIWWGAHDRVVSPREVWWTERVLGIRWPIRMFPLWGHYPMLDDPEGWVMALAREQGCDS